MQGIKNISDKTIEAISHYAWEGVSATVEWAPWEIAKITIRYPVERSIWDAIGNTIWNEITGYEWYWL